MTQILLTGGAGFVGSHTAEALLAKGHHVRVLDVLDPQIHGKERQFPSALDPRVERMRGDVRRPGDLAKALDGIEVVFHFAARTGVGQSQYEVARYVDTNVGGTAALLQAIVGQKTRIKKLVLASSRAVYGEGAARCPRHGQGHPARRVRGDLERGDFQIKCAHCGRDMRPVPTAEDAALDPGSIYALTKKHQEDLCLQTASAHGFSVVILRYFNVYGSRQSLGNPYTGVVTVFFLPTPDDIKKGIGRIRSLGEKPKGGPPRQLRADRPGFVVPSLVWAIPRGWAFGGTKRLLVKPKTFFNGLKGMNKIVDKNGRSHYDEIRMV
ncbi:MAG: NAD-dependent epimerase/dehydratase family protein [Elusimicrobia bacterium]|nr:NAD-dependent epimerase/dehydratase family protein [Elusimicrobiota bacterium]